MPSAPPPAGKSQSAFPWRRVVRWAVTLGLVALVLWFVAGTVGVAWRQLATTTFEIHWAWLLASGLLYIVGLLPMACYWGLVLKRLGQNVPWHHVLRGYYLGHLGKYVPGKAMVIVLRTGTLVAAGTQLRATVVSVFLETLTFMATGAALAAGLIALHTETSPPLVGLAVGLALLAGLPVAPPIARRLARRVAPRDNSDVADPAEGITWSLTAWGVLAAVLSWTTLGLSLWAVLRSLGYADAHPLWQLPVWVESVALPVVAGFLSLLPGGFGVRDTLLLKLLSGAQIPAGAALVTAALWRLISIVSEAAACGIIECSRLIRSSPSLPDDKP